MHPAFNFPRDSLGAYCSDDSIAEQISLGNQRGASSSVSRGLTQPIVSSAEVQRHIDDMTCLWMDAYARWERYRVPADREEALFWLHARDKAILERAAVPRRERAAFGARAANEEPAFFASVQALSIGGAR